MKAFSQITFDFVESPVENEEPSLKARIKALKERKVAEPEQLTDILPQRSGRGRKPLRQLEREASLVEIPDDETLFQKQYYTIGEVARMFSVNTSLIRTWENEFDILEPRKNRKGDRHFRPVDIKNLLVIHDLIRLKKYTLEGAKDYLKKNQKASERFAMVQSLKKIRSYLVELKESL